MPHLERQVSDHQLISYPALRSQGFNGSIVEAERFDRQYRLAIDVLNVAKTITELYVVQLSNCGNLYFTVVEEDRIGEGRQYQLTDIVAVIRRGQHV